jgi:hypothetical protein
VLLEGEWGAVDEGEENVESAGALGGLEGGNFLVVCDSGSASSEVKRLSSGKGGLTEGNGAYGRRIIGLESDILCLVSAIQSVEKTWNYTFPSRIYVS